MSSRQIEEKHLFPFTVSFDRIDAGGVVYHPNYYIYCEQARYHFFQQEGVDFFDHFRSGFVYVVAGIDAKYRAPLELGESYVTLCIPRYLSKKILKISQYFFSKQDAALALELQDNEKQLDRKARFRGNLTLAHVGMESMSGAPLPDNLYEILKPFVKPI